MFKKILKHVKTKSSATTLNGDENGNQRCANCRRFYADLPAHTRKVHMQATAFKCEFCEFTFETQLAKSCHVNKRHFEPQLFRCDKCPSVRFSEEPYLKSHQESMHPTTSRRNANRKDNIKQVCSICSAKFNTVAILNHHLKMTHKFNEDQLLEKPSCPICGREFTYEKSIRGHMRMVHQVNVTPHKCETCCENFTSQKAKTAHDREVHRKGLFKCRRKKCKNLLLTESDRIKHEETHVIPIARRTCSICKKLFIDPSRLRTHLKLVHASDKGTFQCPWCQRGFKLQVTMDYHINHLCRKIQVDEPAAAAVIMSFECLICKKTFPSFEILRNHDQGGHQTLPNADLINIEKIDIMGDEQPTAVQSSWVTVTELNCDEKFPSSDLLQSHVQECHDESDDESLTSGASEDSFSSEGSRQARTEALDKFHIQCRYCAATFTDLEICNRHLLRAHSSIS